MLGYGIDPGSHHVKALEENVARQNAQASRERLRKTQALGFAVTEDELRALSGDSHWPDSWPGEMFAEVLLAKPEYANHPMLGPYRPDGARSDNPYVIFYWDFYAQGKHSFWGRGASMRSLGRERGPCSGRSCSIPDSLAVWTASSGRNMCTPCKTRELCP